MTLKPLYFLKNSLHCAKLFSDYSQKRLYSLFSKQNKNTPHWFITIIAKEKFQEKIIFAAKAKDENLRVHREARCF